MAKNNTGETPLTGVQLLIVTVRDMLQSCR